MTDDGDVVDCRIADEILSSSDHDTSLATRQQLALKVS